jgi:hypothetical protein
LVDAYFAKSQVFVCTSGRGRDWGEDETTGRFNSIRWFVNFRDYSMLMESKENNPQSDWEQNFA